MRNLRIFTVRQPQASRACLSLGFFLLHSDYPPVLEPQNALRARNRLDYA